MKSYFRVLGLILMLFCSRSNATECVDYCKQNGWQSFAGLGFAYKWYAAASEKGYSTGHAPSVGAVLVWDKWEGNNAGHVAIVASIISGTQITVNHANWPKDGQIRLGITVTDTSGGNWNSVKVGSENTSHKILGFIYPSPPVETVNVVTVPRLDDQGNLIGRAGWEEGSSPGCPYGKRWFTFGTSETDWMGVKIASSNICHDVSNFCALPIDLIQSKSENVQKSGLFHMIKTWINKHKDWLSLSALPVSAATCSPITESATLTKYQNGAFALAGGVGAPGNNGSSGNQYVSPESQGGVPVNGSNNSGTKPNLKINSLQPETAAHVVTSSFHIGESARCRMQIKNSGTANAGAFQTRCYISDGFKTDDNPNDEGKEDSQGLDVGDTHTEHEDFIASEYPGQFNMMACTDSASQIAELKEDDQCEEEVPYTVWSSPNLTLLSIWSVDGITDFDPGQAFSVSSQAKNLGENFGKDIRIGWFVTGGMYGTDEVFLDFDSIKRENLKGGMTKTENLGQAIAPEIPGDYELIARIDYDNRIDYETNEADNEIRLSFTVKAPPPSDDDDDLFMMLLF